VNETLTVLNSINERLGLVLEILSTDSVTEKPKYVEVAEKVLATANAALEEVIPAEIEEVSDETPSNENIEIGSIVTYAGDRETLAGKQGTIVDFANAWVVVAFDGEGNHAKCRKSELTLGGNEQPPEVTEVEVVKAEAEEVAKSLFDDEAAIYKIEKGSYKEYRDIHAIYSDVKKTIGNKKYLRFRAKKVVGDDTLTQEMCHRYLIGVQDEEYLKEVGQ
jgi:hypothetical protein